MLKAVLALVDCEKEIEKKVAMAWSTSNADRRQIFPFASSGDQGCQFPIGRPDWCLCGRKFWSWSLRISKNKYLPTPTYIPSLPHNLTCYPPSICHKPKHYLHSVYSQQRDLKLYTSCSVPLSASHFRFKDVTINQIKCKWIEKEEGWLALEFHT